MPRQQNKTNVAWIIVTADTPQATNVLPADILPCDLIHCQTIDAKSGHQLLDFYPRTDTCQQHLTVPACTCSTYTVYIPDMPHVCFPSVRKRLVSQEPAVKKSRSSSSDPDSPDSRVGRVLAKLEQKARLRR